MLTTMHNSSTNKHPNSKYKVSINMLIALLCTLFIQTTCFANKLISFNVPEQQSNTALITFAEQADITILFSYDLTKRYKTNNLSGFYTTDYALQKLLRNTGLIAKCYSDGQIKVEEEAVPQESISKYINRMQQNRSYVEEKDKNGSPHSFIEKISVLGSRANRRTIESLPVPVDILTKERLNNTGQHEIGNILQSLAPSFNVSTSSISDGSDVIKPATLRGLGPDQTLVLINGKRRHQASLIHINNSIGRGTAGVDMSAIPLESIDYIEILRDGASAQYGSDAIAGVINIVLKGKEHKGNISITSGQYSRGDGHTDQIGLSKTLLLDKNTFITATLSIKEHQNTNRSGLDGSCQYKGCIELNNGTFLVNDKREIDAPRTTFKIGDAFYKQTAITLNAEHSHSLGNMYGFYTYSNRDNESFAFFRHNADIPSNIELQDNNAVIPEGFLPKIKSKIKDVSFSIGNTAKLPNGGFVDLSYTYGNNSIDYNVEDSINSSLVSTWLNHSDMPAQQIRNEIPREAYAYGLALSLQTININYTQHFSNISFAMGFEHRIDTYKVIPGEEYAYNDYEVAFHIDQNIAQETDSFSSITNAGIQGFPGISPNLSVNESRATDSLYLELNSDITESLNMIAAVRYDNASSYGSSINYKLSGYYNPAENISFRANFSTGFRAPSMQQLYFNNVSSQFIVNGAQELVPEVVKTFRNDSKVAQSIGIKKLTPEKSNNLSFGIVNKITDNIDLSLDFYQIEIDQRIVISDKIDSAMFDMPDTRYLSNVTKAQFFLNGIKTKTEGVDLVATWEPSLNSSDALTFTLAANLTKTEVIKLYPLAPSLNNPLSHTINTANTSSHDISINELYSQNDISIIENWQPKTRVYLSSEYEKGDWDINISFNYYGAYTITDGDSQKYSPEVVTDIKFNYNVTQAISLYFGSNNLFDVTPDENNIGNSRAGTLIDEQGNVIVSSKGVFKYSRRSAPFGYNGAYFYAGLNYQF